MTQNDLTPHSADNAQAPPRRGKRSIEFDDPVQTMLANRVTESRIAIAGHPLHAMMVAFPIALSIGTFFSDLCYWWTGDLFWARAALWTSGGAFIGGVAAGCVGAVELFAVPGIRVRAASWTHFVIAVMLLSILGANWGYRLDGYEQAVLPYGLMLSAFATGFTGFTGWHGGKLVFDYHLGVSGKGSV